MYDINASTMRVRPASGGSVVCFVTPDVESDRERAKLLLSARSSAG
jgi:hypothetical protein